MTTVYDVILSAEYNLRENGIIGAAVAKSQLATVVKAIEEGKGLYDEVEGEE
jgi:hypothetical protein